MSFSESKPEQSVFKALIEITSTINHPLLKQTLNDLISSFDVNEKPDSDMEVIFEHIIFLVKVCVANKVRTPGRPSAQESLAILIGHILDLNNCLADVFEESGSGFDDDIDEDDDFIDDSEFERGSSIKEPRKRTKQESVVATPPFSVDRKK